VKFPQKFEQHFNRNRKITPKIHMEAQKTPKSQNNPDS
jgi:hypothetical protein